MGITTNRSFEIIACNLPAWPDAAIAIAASRADATGVLNLEESHDVAQASRDLNRLARYGRGSIGVKLRLDTGLAQGILATLPAAVDVLILTGFDSASLQKAVAAAQSTGRRILAECLSVDDARAAKACGVDGLIAKGHESGGHVGEETTFILVQRLLTESDLPVWACGGIGLHSAAACYAAGCSGVILDVQLALARESGVPSSLAAVLEKIDGDETVCLGNDLGDLFRAYRRPGMGAVEALQRMETTLAGSADGDPRARWREKIRSCVGWEHPDRHVFPLGQDAVLAAPLARRFRTVSRIIDGYRSACATHISLASAQRALDRGGPLAASHKTEYPVLQGPMTRVSDTPDFAQAVAVNGALPFLALALLRGPQVKTLLEETRARLGARSWGVGILGFVPRELREEQLDVIDTVRPPFAIIAGGRPDQAARLEAHGIATYLHVPAPGLLKLFIEDGARRFIFEGRECGGHVGPRTSFVLWESMIDTLLAAVESGAPGPELHVVFAGGIHDARSAAMVAAMAAPLVERGVRIGVLLGTAYLFTEEAVRANAIVENFQREALECTGTVLLESGPGHSTRCVATPFYETFKQTKRRLVAEGRPAEDVRAELENLNLGRLRIASKGIARAEGAGSAAPRYVQVADDRQHVEGMYMIGQLAGLRGSICTMADLHEDVSVRAAAFIESVPVPEPVRTQPQALPRPSEIAIIGMGGLLPRAPDLHAFWANILNKVDAITEVPKDRFDIDLFYDEQRGVRDKVYSRWGGFLEDVPFDPMRYGIPPASLPSIDSLQLLSLEAARQALADSGYLENSAARERCSVILGLSGGLGDLGLKYGIRANLPTMLEPPDGLLERLPEWTEDSFAGILLNVAAGRIANRFDLGGVNYTVDAACASSLAAVYLAVQELERRTSDMVIVGGVDTVQSPFGFMCFATAQALSPRGRCRTFDATADGIAISEGVAMLVLKRLEDAERDGDRVYAVIKGIAGSSDGRGRSLTAPRPEGQRLALERAYGQAGISPATVGLIEAHGTGTVVGDAAEVAALSDVFQQAGAAPASCAIGSVKSMIGHTKSAAGVTGLMKVALALHHKVLPPTLHVENPNPRLRDQSNPFYVNTDPAPWMRSDPSQPRRAGVSSFGFGGTNFHAVLEEYGGDYTDPLEGHGRTTWPSELFVWAGSTEADVERSLDATLAVIEKNPSLPLRAIAASVCSARPAAAQVRAAIVASDAADLTKKLQLARQSLRSGQARVQDPTGIYVRKGAASGKLAFLFSGQGSQSPNMLRDLAVTFPHIRESLHAADDVLSGRLPARLSSYIYPPQAFTPEERSSQMTALTDTAVAQPALGAVEAGLFQLLSDVGVVPDAVAGHSYGEYVALAAAGVISWNELFEVSRARGRAIADSVKDAPGMMAAVSAPVDRVRAALGQGDDVWIANLNAPNQTIISGTTAGVDIAAVVLESAGMRSSRIPVACAFHTPLMEGARQRLAESLSKLSIAPARVPVFSNTTGQPYPAAPSEVRALLSSHLVKPVNFVDEIRGLYAAGVRLFIEVGPKSVLTGLVRQTLDQHDAEVVATDVADRHGVTQLLHVLAQCAVSGAPLRLARLFDGRVENVRRIDQLTTTETKASWVVNGAGARPAQQPVKTYAPIPKPVQPQPESAPVAAFAPQPAVHPSTAAAAGGDPVMLQFQSMMSQFLHTQAAIVTAYLQGGNGITALPLPAPAPAVVPLPQLPLPAIAMNVAAPVAAAAPPAPKRNGEDSRVNAPSAPVAAPRARDVSAELLRLVSDRTGYPADMLDPDLNIEADLGIDSIKRVEILSAFQRTCSPDDQRLIHPMMDRLTSLKTLKQIATAIGEAIHRDPAPASAAAPDVRASRDVLAELVRLVSERTGYPAEMLDPDLNIEADLGIDSIKRVEVLSAFQRTCSADDQRLIHPMMDRLTSLKTLRQIATAIGEAIHRSAAPALAVAPEVPAARDVLAELVQLVSERTGYPAEMLDPDLNIEADLGIDSIKRVEVLSTFQRRGSADEQRCIHQVMDKLSSRKTLRELSAALEHALKGDAAAAVPPAPPTAAIEPVSAEVPRFVMQAVESPLQTTARVVPGRLWLVTDDEKGMAESVAAALNEIDERAVVLRHGTSFAQLGERTFGANLADPSQLSQVLREVEKNFGKPNALLHLLPLKPGRPVEELTIDEWQERVTSDVKTLYALVRATGANLAESEDGAMILGVTAMGAAFAGGAPDFPLAHGGIAGFLKTAAIEMPSVACRTLHLDLAEGSSRLRAHLLAEMGTATGPAEAVYSGNRRLTLVPRLEPVARATDAILGADSVVLVTGGARGVTAEIAVVLAGAVKPRVILAGKSRRPAPESAPTRGIDDPQQLRQVLMTSMRASDASVKPSDIEAAMQRVLRDREMTRNLAAMEAAGGKVEYADVDVRDAAAFGALIDRIYAEHGRLDAVIHGAGIIEDKLVKDKTGESFDRVVGTKVDSLYTLLRKLRFADLKGLMFMSSVTATFGNRGQADYGAANGILNAAAMAVAHRWPVRVRSMNWGPWDKTGMVSEDVKRQFASRGVQVIPVDAGASLAVEDLLFTTGRETWIVIGDGPWRDQAARAQEVELTA